MNFNEQQIETLKNYAIHPKFGEIARFSREWKMPYSTIATHVKRLRKELKKQKVAVGTLSVSKRRYSKKATRSTPNLSGPIMNFPPPTSNVVSIPYKRVWLEGKNLMVEL